MDNGRYWIDDMVKELMSIIVWLNNIVQKLLGNFDNNIGNKMLEILWLNNARNDNVDISQHYKRINPMDDATLNKDENKCF